MEGSNVAALLADLLPRLFESFRHLVCEGAWMLPWVYLGDRGFESSLIFNFPYR